MIKPQAYHERVMKTVFDRTNFLSASFSGVISGDLPWRKVTIRPVEIKGKHQLQFSYLDAKQDTTKNYLEEEAKVRVTELLSLPFRSIFLKTLDGDVQVSIREDGSAKIHHHSLKEERAEPDLGHDRRKDLLLPDGEADPFLIGVGLMTRDGRVRAAMQSKFRQVNEFLRFMLESGFFERQEGKALHIVDCGCGSAILTFAATYYLREKLGFRVQLTGVDVNEELLDRTARQAQELGMDDVHFAASSILSFTPHEPVDVVIALHACDTATDEALAKGVEWGCGLIVSVPCCHHHLQAQMAKNERPVAFQSLLRHGILRERLGDLLTDSFRANILRILGYRADVIEFISTEHTARNLMIRALHSAGMNRGSALEEYVAMRAYWGVRPHLEELLASRLAQAGLEDHRTDA